MKSILATTLALISLAGCAAAPNTIDAAYVSPVVYADWTCHSMNVEAQRMTTELARLTGQQQQQANNDAIATGVALILFWPAVFFLGGDDNAPEIAQLRGEAEALYAAATEKGCNG